MAVSVTSDLTVRHSMDTTTNTSSDSNKISGVGQTSTDFSVQGTASNIAQFKSGSPTTGWYSGSFTSDDFSKLHIYGWINNLDNVESLANGGWRMRISSSNANMGSAYGEWTVSGQDVVSRPISGFARFCVDANKPFDFTGGTPVALASVAAIAISINGPSGGSGQNTWFIDSLDTATGINVGGGTTSAPGQSSEIASDDITNGRGIFKNVIGAYYVLGRVTIGHTTLASEYFDSGEVWVFEDMPVSATFYKIEFIGSSSTNNANFGTKSGTGTAAEGSGGNTFKATGDSPLRLEATESDIDVGLYGCNFLNPSTLKEDALRAYQYANNADSFTDQTRQAGNTATGDFLFMPGSEDVGSKSVYGHDEPFSQLKITYSTAGVSATGSITWEYWSGSAWSALTDVTDGTNSFKNAAGTYLVTYSIPSDWATTTLNSRGPYYYIRGRVTTAVYTTNPAGTQVFAVMGGRARLEQANAEAIRCVFTNMDTVVVRNGAFLKKCTITDTVAPSKSAALDLGSADPTTDTVRDLTIQNSGRGILLTPTTTTAYNFRNIGFSNCASVSAAITDDGGVYTDKTTEANNTSTFALFPTTELANDRFYVGYHSPFHLVRFSLVTAGVGGVVTWEYYNGSTWSSLETLTGFSDGTTDLTASGDLVLGVPDDWATSTENTTQGPFYYIRATISTTYSTNPTASRVRAGYNVRVEAPSLSTVTINLLEGTTSFVEDDVDNVNSSTIVINNAVSLKVTVVDRADNGPVELVQVAIYQTSDDTQLMNEDTETVTAGSFVVGVKYRIVTVGTTDFTAIGAASNTVGVVFTATGIGSGTGTATNGVALESFNYTGDTPIYVRVRKSSTGSTRYIPFSTTGTITSSGFTSTITITEDTNA